MADSAKYKKGGGESCVIVGCSNSRRRLHQWKIEECSIHGILHSSCPCLLPFSLHRMPDKEDARLAWCAAINRPTGSLPKRVIVCSEHFIDGRPTAQNNVPSLKLGNQKEVKPVRRFLKRKLLDNLTDTPSKISCEDSDLESVGVCELHNEDGENVQGTSTDVYTQTDTSNTSTSTQWYAEDQQDHTYRVMRSSQKMTNDISTQTISMTSVSKGVNCSTTHINMSYDKISTDADSLLYTGLTLQVFATFTRVFQGIATRFKFTIDVVDQLLLFLMRLRLNLLFADLGNRFGTSESNASKIFNCWLPLVSQKLKQLIVWLPREAIRATMPAVFKEKYPKTTVIIDYAETFIQRPKNLKTRGETYSQYNSHNTVKYLVGISPHGQFMFISKGFGGRASDKFIVEKSGFLQYLLPGDEIMADRGFTIKVLLFPIQAKLNMPAFTKGKPRLSDMEVTETRRIAHVRIHVERAIRRLKVFRILSNIVPVSSVKKLDDILIVCAALVNLGPELIKDSRMDVEQENSE